MYVCEELLWWYTALHRFLLRILGRAALPPGIRVLDIGCGSGGFASQLKKCGYRVVGLDRSWRGIRFSRARGLTALVQGDANRLPFRDGSFDLVICIDVLEEGPVLPEKLLPEMERVARSGALVLLQTSAYQWLLSRHDRAVEATRRFTRRQLQDLIRGARLEPRYATYLFTLLFPLLAAWKLLHPYPEDPGRPVPNDIRMPPRPINALLDGLCRLESLLIPSWRLPFGTSVCALAQKPGAGPHPGQ
jgi:ubiquinone/menaquinone biosynthesis C-methylase UbiE